MTEPAANTPSELKIATLEVLWKALAGLVLQTSNDPNARHYLWNTFENSVDALNISGPPTDQTEIVREQIRVYGQAILSSTYQGANRQS